MKFADEFRDADLARALGDRIAAESGDKHWKIMEVCGGHTHTIFKYGIEDLLPSNVELVLKALPFGIAIKFFYGSLSDFEYTITLTNTLIGSVRTYHNPPGTFCGGIDDHAF